MHPDRRSDGDPAGRWRGRLDRLAGMPYTRDDCLFCKIVAGDIPADVVHRDDHVVAFRDIAPKAPTHILLVPTTHYANAAEVAADDPHGLAALVVTARALAAADGVEQTGYRLLFNTGEGAGQTVFHAHLHLLGGRSLGWPPG
jgi:histidine triad (HIT) family protein